MEWVYVVTEDDKIVDHGIEVCFSFFIDKWYKSERYKAIVYPIIHHSFSMVDIDKYRSYLSRTGLYPFIEDRFYKYNYLEWDNYSTPHHQTLHHLNALRYIWEVPSIVASIVYDGLSFIDAHKSNRNKILFGHSNIMDYKGIPKDYEQRIKTMNLSKFNYLSDHMFEGVEEWL